MSDIIVTEEEDKITYQATQEDEEAFFLMYNMKLQPSEIQAMTKEYRQWLIGRFVAQKQMEQEAIERHRLMNQIGSKLTV